MTTLKYTGKSQIDKLIHLLAATDRLIRRRKGHPSHRNPLRWFPGW